MGRQGWHRTSKGRPCEVCGRSGWCGYADDGVVQCMHMHGQPVAGFELLSVKPNSHGYECSNYWPTGLPRDKRPPAPDPEKEKARKLEEERRRERAAGWARELWTRIGRVQGAEDHPRARAYFAARGVPLEMLPAGRLPPSIRFDPQLARDEVEAVHTYTDPATGRKKTRTTYRDPKPRYPGVVCAGVGYHRVERGGEGGGEGGGVGGVEVVKCVRCVQRIYLDETGLPKKIGHGDQKKCQGPTGGAAVRLSEPDVKHGVLVLCEGIETGVALLAAMGREDGSWPAVWACISTSGLMSVELGEDVRKWVRRVIIAGDHDHLDQNMHARPGEFAARACQNRLLRLWGSTLDMGVDVALPGHRVAPDLVREDGWVRLGEVVEQAQGVDGEQAA